MQIHNASTFDQLTDDDCSDILEDLHRVSTDSEHEMLNQAGFQVVSKFPFYSSDGAKDKVNALREYFLTQPQELTKFNPDEFYKYPNETSLFYTTPQQAGCELIAQYYDEKYNAQITFPKDDQGEGIPSYLFQQQEIGINQIQQARENASQHKGDYRQAFFFGPAVEAHSTPIIYIKENGEEAILIADSIGGKSESRLSSAIANFTYKDGKKIPVYAVKEGRQADVLSCFIDSLVFGRDTTGINKETGKYYIPDLLSKLKSRCSEHENHFSVLLPDQLLKTAQRSVFVQQNRQAENPIIHKGKTLQQFRDENSYTVTIKTANGNRPQSKSISNYARGKGIKAADQIEIQFYLNQLNEQSNPPLSSEERAHFIADAKRELQRQLEKFDPQNNGLINQTEKYFTSREGLHAWATQWAVNRSKA